MDYDNADEYVKLEDESLLHDILLILRHAKGVKPKDIAKMTIQEIRYFALLVQEDERKQAEALNKAKT